MPRRMPLDRAAAVAGRIQALRASPRTPAKAKTFLRGVATWLASHGSVTPAQRRAVENLWEQHEVSGFPPEHGLAPAATRDRGSPAREAYIRSVPF